MAGLRLKAVRDALEIGQEAFASKIGVSRTALANWEGGRLPDVVAMIRLFQVFGIPIEWVYCGMLRNVPYELAQQLEERAAELNAAVGAPTVEWPMQVERKPGIAGLRPPGAVPRRRKRRNQLHEPPPC